jgi:hypothetical protein
LEVRPRSRSTARNGWPLYIASRSFCRISTGSRFCARARPRASPRRSGLHGIGRSRSLPASGSGCRAAPEGCGGDPGDQSHHGPGATTARPGRLRYQAQGEPPSDDRRRHIARSSRLANGGDPVGLAHHHAYPSGPSPFAAPHCHSAKR